VKSRPRVRLKRSTSSWISSIVVPASSRRWIASARMTVPPEVTPESMTVTRASPADSAARRALSQVPESFADSMTARMFS
jgi:hypothetical protein